MISAFKKKPKGEKKHMEALGNDLCNKLHSISEHFSQGEM